MAWRHHFCTAVAWTSGKAAAYHTSPLIVGDRLYIFLDQGFASCYDVKTGTPHYERERLNGVGEFCASPWHMNGKVFALSETGATVVLKEGPKYELLGVNQLKESCLATPAFAGDSIYLRTLTKLYRIAAAK